MSDEAVQPEPARRRRAGGRERTRAAASRAIEQLPFREVQRHFEPTRMVSDDEVESIHDASLVVLRDIGIDVLDADARALLAAAGADVSADSERVRFDPAMVVELISTCPSEFTLHSWNADHDLRIGGNNVVFSAVASPPNVSDAAGGRRTGNREDFRNLVRLSQHFNAIHMHAGYPVEPADIHPSVRHIHATHDLLTLSDKVVNVYSLGRERNLDCMEMVRIARQIPDERLDSEPSVYTIINSSSPLRLDIPMLQGIMAYSARNQPIVITPFTLAGAMAPVTVAGAVTQQNAEALAGMVMTQVVRSGSPVVYGGFTSNVDMRSGSPAFGTPEYIKSAMLGGQMARRYDLPYRSSNVNAANAVDAQAGYESVMSLWGAIMGGANIVFHGAGWLEGGLRASFEKMVLDVDLLQMMQVFLEPLGMTPDDLALEAIADVGPGGHFFGTQHTQDRYKSAFYGPMVSDWRNFESWEEAGSPTADQRAAELVPRFLAECVPPEMPDDVRAELDEFVERRVAAGGVATDF
ncbi:MAG: trimethylamine methyltransferase family protein [Acidimicrobiales bacterium]